LVGSQAHGLAGPESDFDYREIFAYPTEKILSLGPKPQNIQAPKEEKEDFSAWEVGHFLHLATKCNPTILEALHAPAKITSPEGETIQKEVFQHAWNTKNLVDAAIGYGIEQRKRFLGDKNEAGRPKYACAYLRTLYQAYHFLAHGQYLVNMSGTEVFDTLKNYKAGNFEMWEVISTCFSWQKKLKDIAAKVPEKHTNFEPINSILLDIREKFWYCVPEPTTTITTKKMVNFSKNSYFNL
jgi:predicted nucleotidyltransferase